MPIVELLDTEALNARNSEAERLRSAAEKATTAQATAVARLASATACLEQTTRDAKAQPTVYVDNRLATAVALAAKAAGTASTVYVTGNLPEPTPARGVLLVSQGGGPGVDYRTGQLCSDWKLPRELPLPGSAEVTLRLYRAAEDVPLNPHALSAEDLSFRCGDVATSRVSDDLVVDRVTLGNLWAFAPTPTLDGSVPFKSAAAVWLAGQARKLSLTARTNLASTVSEAVEHLGSERLRTVVVRGSVSVAVASMEATPEAMAEEMKAALGATGSAVGSLGRLSEVSVSTKVGTPAGLGGQFVTAAVTATFRSAAPDPEAKLY